MGDDWEKKRPKRRRDDEGDEGDGRGDGGAGGDTSPRFRKRPRRVADADEFDETPDGRPYIHDKCGEATVVSEGHFAHICDPFRPCTGTFCVTCNGFFPLTEVRWADTDESISDYRERMKQLTPAPLRVWRSGVGCLVGLVVGLLVGFLLRVGLKAQGGIGWYLGLGAVIGSVAIAVIGSVILEAKYPIDYRRKR